MCGIIGLIGEPHSTFAQERGLGLLAHRGPDGSGVMHATCSGKKVWLGHTRLSILDLSSAGHQPMVSRDERWCLTFNGEIYNHMELRKEIPVPWRGHSDTETLVEMLAAWGVPKTLKRLNGMFAFAAVDLVEGKLYLVRDPFGVKPLYFTERRQGIAFSSEVRALAAATHTRFQINGNALQTFLSLRFVPSPHTLLANVHRLPAAHYLEMDIGTGMRAQHRYAEPGSLRFRGSLSDAVDRYHILLQQAVRRQMLSDVPVGILLSGGIDSAFLAAIAATQGARTPCFSVGFGESFPECELADASETANILGLPIHPVQVTHEDLWTVFAPCIASIEEPLGTSSVLPMWYLTQRARESVKVVLTGQGSDEPWGGYRRYQSELLRTLPLVPQLAQHLAPAVLRNFDLPEHMGRALQALPHNDTRTRFEHEYCLFTPAQRLALTGRSDCGDAMDAIGYWLDALPGGRATNGAEMMMTIDSRMGLSDDLLLYGDKVSMAHSLEARVPMLDLELVRFIESLPLKYRVSLRRGKVAHKIAAERFLPARIVHRKKRAFTVPFGEWIRTCWHDRVEEQLFSPSSSHLDWIDPAGIRPIWQAHQNGKKDYSRQLFALIAFSFWGKEMQRYASESVDSDPLFSMGGNNAYLV